MNNPITEFKAINELVKQVQYLIVKWSQMHYTVFYCIELRQIEETC